MAIADSIVTLCPSADDLNSEEKTCVQCPQCAKNLSQQSLLPLHLFKVHGITQDGHPVSKDALIYYHCPVVSCVYRKDGGHKHFTAYKALKQHYMKVHAEKKHRCSRCSRSFGLARDMKWHEESCGMTFTCKSCDNCYVTREALATHCARSNHPYPEEYKPPKERASIKKSSDASLPLADLVFKVYVQGPKIALQPQIPSAVVTSGVQKPLLPKPAFPGKQADLVQNKPANVPDDTETRTMSGDIFRTTTIQTIPTCTRLGSDNVQRFPSESLEMGVAPAPRGVAVDLRGVASSPRGMVLNPRGLAAVPRGVVSSPRGVASSPRGVALNPRGLASALKCVVSSPKGVTSAIMGVDSNQRNIPRGNVRTATATQTQNRHQASTETQTPAPAKKNQQVAETQTAGDFIVKEAMRIAQIPAVKISKGSQVSPKSSIKPANQQVTSRRRTRSRLLSAPYATPPLERSKQKNIQNPPDNSLTFWGATENMAAVQGGPSQGEGEICVVGEKRGSMVDRAASVSVETPSNRQQMVESGTSMNDLSLFSETEPRSSKNVDKLTGGVSLQSTGLLSSDLLVQHGQPVDGACHGFQENMEFRESRNTSTIIDSDLPQPISLTDLTESGTQTSALLEELERLAESIATQTHSSFLNSQHPGGTQSSETQTAISTLDRDISPERIVSGKLTGVGDCLGIIENQDGVTVCGQERKKMSEKVRNETVLTGSRHSLVENEEVGRRSSIGVTEAATSYEFSHMETQTLGNENTFLGTVFSDSGVQTAEDFMNMETQTAEDFMNMETQTVGDWVDEFLSSMGTQTDDILFPDLSLADIQTQTEAPSGYITMSSAFHQPFNISGLHQADLRPRHPSGVNITAIRATDNQTQTTDSEAPSSGNFLSNIEIQTSLHSLPSAAELPQSSECETQTGSGIDSHTQTIMDTDLESLLEELEGKK